MQEGSGFLRSRGCASITSEKPAQGGKLRSAEQRAAQRWGFGPGERMRAGMRVPPPARSRTTSPSEPSRGDPCPRSCAPSSGRLLADATVELGGFGSVGGIEQAGAPQGSGWHIGGPVAPPGAGRPWHLSCHITACATCSRLQTVAKQTPGTFTGLARRWRTAAPRAQTPSRPPPAAGPTPPSLPSPQLMGGPGRGASEGRARLGPSTNLVCTLKPAI